MAYLGAIVKGKTNEGQEENLGSKGSERLQTTSDEDRFRIQFEELCAAARTAEEDAELADSNLHLNLENAYSDFNESVMLDPSNPNAFFNRGILCVHDGDKEEAMENVRTLIRTIFRESSRIFPQLTQSNVQV